jgi:predicted site-specific integrase-resolvase
MLSSRYYSAHELAEVLAKLGVKVAVATVTNAIHKGRLSAIRLKGQWLIVPDERLYKWVEELKATAERRARMGRKPKTIVAGERNG